MIEYNRSRYGFGRTLTMGVANRHRVRLNSYGATTPNWPHVERGGDEHCNRAITIVAWPFIMIDIWWEPKRTWRATGMCPDCTAYCEAEGLCVHCGGRPCACEEIATITRENS